jgi:hypothetical protein
VETGSSVGKRVGREKASLQTHSSIGQGLTYLVGEGPNPAGQSILSPCIEGGISPLGLLAEAKAPTLVFAGLFLLWR